MQNLRDTIKNDILDLYYCIVSIFSSQLLVKEGGMKTAAAMRRWGWISFRVMWIPFFTLFIGMIGVPEGSYAFSELPLLTRVSIIAVAALGGLSMILLFGAVLVSQREATSIRQSGVTTTARILELRDTGTTINQDPVVRLVLEVQPKNAPAFQTETEQLVSRLQIPQIQPGKTLLVKYDPADNDVALLFDQSGTVDPDHLINPG